MANVIARAKGHNRDGSTECSRLASQSAEVIVNTHYTFVTVTMQKDGSARIVVARRMPGQVAGERTTLSEIQLNSESAESPSMACDGLLAKQVVDSAFDKMAR